MEHKTPKNINNPKLLVSQAIKKFGLDNFDFRIIEELDNKDELNDKEVFWIEKLNPEYNICSGGKGTKGHIVTKEVRKHLKEIGKKRRKGMTKEERNKVIENNLTGPTRGKKRSLETRNKISKSLKLLGRKHTDEWKLYMSVKMKDSMVGNKNGNKKVIAMKNGEKIKEFDSVKSGAERIGVTPGCVTGVLKGRRKRSGGYERVYG